MSDDKQLEVYSFIEFCREFSLVKSSTTNQKGKRKGKGSKAQRLKDFIFYLSHRKTLLSRGTHQKSLVRGRDA
jgi:hypothetical protein